MEEQLGRAGESSLNISKCPHLPSVMSLLWAELEDCPFVCRVARAVQCTRHCDGVFASHTSSLVESTRVGSRASAELARARVDEDRGEEVAWGSEGEGGGPGPP